MKLSEVCSLLSRGYVVYDSDGTAYQIVDMGNILGELLMGLNAKGYSFETDIPIMYPNKMMMRDEYERLKRHLEVE